MLAPNSVRDVRRRRSWRRVLDVFRRRADRDGIVKITHAELCAIARCSRMTAIRRIRELERLGILTVKRVKVGGPNSYRFNVEFYFLDGKHRRRE